MKNKGAPKTAGCFHVAMAGIDHGKKFKKVRPPKTTKRELSDLTVFAIGLIHVFTKEPITTDNMAEISKRYKKPDGNLYSSRKLYNEFLNIAKEESQRLRQDPKKSLINHYLRCINWLNSKGNRPAEKAAKKELDELRNKQVNN